MKTTGSSWWGNQGSWTHTYDLGGREVRKTLLRGRGVLAGLPVGQWVLLLRLCGQQAGEGFGEGCPASQQALIIQECLVSGARVLFEQVLITQAAGPCSQHCFSSKNRVQWCFRHRFLSRRGWSGFLAGSAPSPPPAPGQKWPSHRALGSRGGALWSLY